ncbi:MAG: TlpA disulfide reductase family protein [Candidatus Nanopelagicales bacterium]
MKKVVFLMFIALTLTGCGNFLSSSSDTAIIINESDLGDSSAQQATDIGLTFIAVPDREPIPPIAGLDLNLEPIAISDYLGKVTVVNAWASWCAPCIEETPELVATQEATRKLGVQFLGLNVNDDLESARNFAQAITYPSIADPEGRLLSLVPGIPPNGLPSTLVVDKDGLIAVRIIGPITKEVLTALITEVAAE